MQEGASPGGPRMSTAKKRRLAALEQSRGVSTSTSAAAAAAPQANAATRSSPGGGKRSGSAGGQGRGQAGSGNGNGTPARSQQQQQQQGQHQRQKQQQLQQQQAAEPPYARLDEAISLGPAAEAMQLPRPEPNSQVVSGLLEQLMATNPRAFDARAAIGLKVQDRTVMLDNPVGQKQQLSQQQQQGRGSNGGGGAGGRRQQQRGGSGARWTAALASRRQQRELGLYQLEREGLTYESVLPLHRSWQQYMVELLAPGGASRSAGAARPAGPADLEARLYAADLHGCLIRVASTADPRYQGLSGIVVRDTANTLQLVTPASRFVTVPKQLCTWEFDADRRRVVTLLGPGLVQRGAGIGGGGAGGGSGGGARPKTLREAIRGQQKR